MVEGAGDAGLVQAEGGESFGLITLSRFCVRMEPDLSGGPSAYRLFSMALARLRRQESSAKDCTR